MTLATWKSEFYPVEASQVASEDAIAHSLRKWTGLLSENRKKHHVFLRQGRRRLFDDIIQNLKDGFWIDKDTCALCTHYYREEFRGCDDRKCVDCPLHKALGGKDCDDDNQPYVTWLTAGDPQPMIDALKLAAELAAP